MGGAIGDGADRLVRPPHPLRGGVIDWITVYGRSPIFNVAGAALEAGALVAVALLASNAVRALGRKRSPDGR